MFAAPTRPRSSHAPSSRTIRSTGDACTTVTSGDQPELAPELHLVRERARCDAQAPRGLGLVAAGRLDRAEDRLALEVGERAVRERRGRGDRAEVLTLVGD